MALGRKVKALRRAEFDPNVQNDRLSREDNRKGQLAEKLQRNYGNQTTGRWHRAQIQAQQVPEAARGLSGLYADIVMKFASSADAESERVWRRFSAMTTGQRQAVLLDMAGSADRLEQIQGRPLDWSSLQLSMETVEGVRLQPNEPEREGNARESGVELMRGAVDVTGLLEPYRDIVKWLNYKANKQGKSALMQRFELMSIPQKKIALHKMVQKRKLHFRTFTDTMTVTLQLKQWVDWDKMMRAISEAEDIALDESDEQAAERYLGFMDETEEVHDEELQEEDKEADDQDDSLFFFAKPGSANKKKNRQSPTDFRELLQQPEHLIWLLFGLRVNAADLKKKKMSSAVGAPDVIVDRFLNMKEGLAPKERESARKKQLKQFGFQSMRQCYIYLLLLIVSLLHERGVVKREQKFVAINEQLGLFGKQSAPTKEQIAQKLRVSQ